MSRAPRVLYALPRLELGGSERHVIRLAAAVAAAEGEAGIVCLYQEGSLAGEARARGARVHALGLGGVADPRALPLLVAALGRFKPHVVHACLFGFDALVAWPARLLKVPLVLSTRRELATWMRPRHRLVRAAGCLAADIVVCCSEAVRSQALAEEGLDPARVLTIRNGVDLAPFREARAQRSAARGDWGFAADDLVVTTVANFDVEKGYDVWLQALPEVLKRLPRARLVWAGDGPLHGRVSSELAAAGRSARVVVSGRVDDVPRLLAASDVFVLPSLSEGLPNALLEALAAGLPSVVTRVGGVPELVTDGVHGLLVAAGDSQALAAAVVRLGQSPGLREALALAAARRAGDFDEERSTRRYLELYMSAWQRTLT